MTEMHSTRIQRLPKPVVAVLHIVGPFVGAGAALVLAVIVSIVLHVEDKDKNAALVLVLMLFGAVLPSVLLWRARRLSPAGAPPPIPQSQSPLLQKVSGGAMTKSTVKIPLASMTGIFIFLALLGLIVIKVDSQPSPRKTISQSEELPACDSKRTVDGLKEMVRKAPTNKLIYLELLAVKDAKELSWDSKEQVRRCTAKFFLNSGLEDVSYKLFWLDRAKGEILIGTD